MSYTDGRIGYFTLPIPQAILLYYWFQRDGWNYRLFSLAWIGYMITDASSIVDKSASSPLTASLAIVSISLLIVGFTLWREGYARKRAYLGLIAVAYGAGYFSLIEDSIPSNLYAAIAIYAVLDAVIFIIVAGMRLRNNYSYMLALFGVSIFVLADGLYAYHFFVEPFEFGESYITLLHNICRLLLVLAISSENATIQQNQ